MLLSYLWYVLLKKVIKLILKQSEDSLVLTSSEKFLSFCLIFFYRTFKMCTAFKENI